MLRYLIRLETRGLKTNSFGAIVLKIHFENTILFEIIREIRCVFPWWSYLKSCLRVC